MLLEHFGTLVPLLKATKKKYSSYLSSNTYTVKVCGEHGLVGFVKLGIQTKTAAMVKAKNALCQDIGKFVITRRFPLEFREVKAEFDGFLLKSTIPLYGHSGYYLPDNTGRVTGKSPTHTSMMLGDKQVSLGCS